ncbi:MAG: PP2C family serine/threonine-protein phosphatase [Burkholderiaceae bacterium]
MRVIESSLRDLKVAACTGQHRGDRAEQQDRVSVLQGRASQRCALGVLADGLGGRSGGALAAENVILTSQRCFDGFAPSEDTPARFFETLVDEVHAVLKLTALATDKEPHSTFAAVLMQPDRVDWCHVGDSRIYHFRGAELQHCTADHTYAWQLVVEGRASPESARLHPSADMLVNSIGGTGRPWPDIGSTTAPGNDDSFLLCSDGLWAYFDAEELGRIIAGNSCREASARLIDLARERARGRGDNCSLVLFKLDPA